MSAKTSVSAETFLPSDLPVDASAKLLGAELRDLRVRYGKTAKQIAASSGMSASKLSKIEHGLRAPSESDVFSLSKSLELSPDVADRLVRLARHLRRDPVGSSKLLELNKRVDDAHYDAQELRWFEGTVIPGAFQTPAYAWQILRRGAPPLSTPSEIDGAVLTRLRRQVELHNPTRKFTFVLTLTSLVSLVLPSELMSQQYRRIREAMDIPTVTVHLVATPPPVAGTGYVIYDQNLVIEEQRYQVWEIRDPSEIALYEHDFEQRKADAYSEEECRDLLVRLENNPYDGSIVIDLLQRDLFERTEYELQTSSRAQP